VQRALPPGAPPHPSRHFPKTGHLFAPLKVIMKYTEWLPYKDKVFLVLRAVNVDDDGMFEAMTELKNEIIKKPDALTLVDLTGTRMTSRINQIAKTINKEITNHLEQNGLPMRPSALVGIRPIIRAVVQLITTNEKTYYAKSFADAQEWLYNQE
jgi:hypothetical protein